MLKKAENSSLITAPLAIRITRFVDGNRRIRFVIQDLETLQPIKSLSVYEAYLSKKHKSPNTVFDALQKLAYVFTYAKQFRIVIDTLLMTGEMLEARDVNSFNFWLSERINVKSQKKIAQKTINSILGQTSKAFRWFADQYAVFEGRSSERTIKLRLYKNEIAEKFSEKIMSVKSKPMADDLTDDEIKKIDEFLFPENRRKNFPKLSEAQLIRDYLIWRLVIEFGLREGEILALRLEDCPHKHQDYIKIVRVDGRGDDYIDPRGAYAPRPKTLGRELGFVYENTEIKKLLNEYITKHRRRRVVEHGKKFLKPIFDVPSFLILSHKNDAGTPLSLSSLLDIAKTIRVNTGIPHFHWHIGRHAFFNRRYEEIMALKHKDEERYKNRLNDLIYYGGWESELSLQLYINRARRDSARNVLKNRLIDEGK